MRMFLSDSFAITGEESRMFLCFLPPWRWEEAFWGAPELVFTLTAQGPGVPHARPWER